jgi:hypothetical protein
MASAGQLDDVTIESIVAGDRVDARFDRIVAFVRQVRSLGEGSPPAPSLALRVVLAGGGRQVRPRCRIRARGRRRR